VTTLQNLVAREVNAQQAAVISVGTLHAGTTAANIIADSATLSGTVRWFDADVGDLLARRIPEVIQGIATTLRGSAEVEYRRGGKTTVNDTAVAALVREALAEVVGDDHVQSGPRIMGSEDFSEFTHRLPSTFFFVGSRDEATGKHFDHHHPRFDIDERCLPLAVEMMTRSALRWLEANAG
jgi:amidohydrolase